MPVMKKISNVYYLFILLPVVMNCQISPYISLMGQILVNHSYVDVAMIEYSQNIALICHTDLETCCSQTEGIHRGDWYFPSGDRLPFSGSGDTIEDRRDQKVQLYRLRGNPPFGIYHCEIPTITVHDDNNPLLTRESIYVGIYNDNEGSITIEANSITTSPISIVDQSYVRQFSLTCVSTGGPATNVTWTRDSSVVITQGTKTVLNDPVTSQYTHTVVASQVGVYSCSVVNNKPSSASATITIGTLPPKNLTAIQDGPTSIRVSWIPPSPFGNITGFRVSFYGQTNNGTTTVSIVTSSFSLVNLRSGEMYTIFVYSISEGVNVPTVAGPIGLAPFFAPILNSVLETTTTEIVLTGSTPTTSSIVTGFIVEWQRNTSIGCSDTNSSTSIHVDGIFEVYNVTGLEPGNWYTISVKATNAVGSGPASDATARTQEAAPSGPPLSLRQGFVTPNSITVHWDEVQCLEQNGEIAGYRVYTIRDGMLNENITVAWHTKEAILLHLLHSTSYTVRVAAFNDVDEGPYSEIIIETEGEVVLYANSTSASITLWWILEQSLIAMKYSVSYGDTDRNCVTTISSIPGNETEFTLTGLEEATEYSIIVTATFSDRTGTGKDNITLSTQESTPSAPPLFVRVKIKNSRVIDVHWGPLDCRHRNGEIVGYSVKYGQDGIQESEKTVLRVSGDPNTGRMLTISDLAKDTVYTVQVAAETSAGIGIYSASQTAETPNVVYMTLNGLIIRNHSYILISDIGSTEETALLCHTNHPVKPGSSNSGGDWYAPDGTRVNVDDVPGLTRNRGPMVVRLFQTTSTFDVPEGLYHCSVNDKNLVSHRVFIGLYYRGSGNIVLEVLPPILASNEESHNIMFTLTCISSGGPATSVSWTRNSLFNITDGIETQFDPNTTVYCHYLNTSKAGDYMCTVENHAFSTSANITLREIQPPDGLRVKQNGPSSVIVTWNQSNADGYMINYGIGMEELMDELVYGNTTNLVLTGLGNNLEYTISVIATSVDNLPSAPVTVQIILVPIPSQPQVEKENVFATDSKIFLSWTVSPNISRSIVSWNHQGEGSTVTNGSSGSITTNAYTIVGLLSDTSYDITVTVFNPAGNSSTTFSHPTAEGSGMTTCEFVTIGVTSLVATLAIVTLTAVTAILILLAIIAVLVTRSRRARKVVKRETEFSEITNPQTRKGDEGILTTGNKAYKEVRKAEMAGGSLRRSTFSVDVVTDASNDDTLYVNL